MRVYQSPAWSHVWSVAGARGIDHDSVFGPYARVDAHAESDIDLLVDRGGGRIMRVPGLATEVEDATGKSVDIYDGSELPSGDFRDMVLGEAVAL